MSLLCACRMAPWLQLNGPIRPVTRLVAKSQLIERGLLVMICSTKKIIPSEKSAHQSVEINDMNAGEIWREQVIIHSTNGGKALKWRWFAVTDEGNRLGRGTRSSFLLGPGFKGKDAVIKALIEGREIKFQIEDKPGT